MYKSVPKDIEKIKLDASLYKVHKEAHIKSDFGLDNDSSLLDQGFGLYSTANLKRNIGPMKTEYYRVSLTRNGTAQINIGLENFKPYRNCILFGFPGQVFSLHNVSEDFFAYYMLFTEQFIADASFLQNKKKQFPFLSYLGVQSFELDENTALEVEHIIFKMNEEVKSRRPGCSDLLRLYIQEIFIHASRVYGDRLHSPKDESNPWYNLFLKYIKLVSQHFIDVRKVSEYAAMLNVSPDHLNRAIKSSSDKTALELINEMLLIEAKSYLLHSQLSVSEIAYKLEFSDPSYFNRFFRKHCGQTPSDFRKKSG